MQSEAYTTSISGSPGLLAVMVASGQWPYAHVADSGLMKTMHAGDEAKAHRDVSQKQWENKQAVATNLGLFFQRSSRHSVL